MHVIVCICIHGFDRGLPLKNDLSVLIFLYNVILHDDNNKLSITCGRFIKRRLTQCYFGSIEKNETIRHHTMIGRSVRKSSLLILQVITARRVNFLLLTFIFIQCCIYLKFRYKIYLKIIIFIITYYCCFPILIFHGKRCEQ